MSNFIESIENCIVNRGTVNKHELSITSNIYFSIVNEQVAITRAVVGFLKVLSMVVSVRRENIDSKLSSRGTNIFKLNKGMMLKVVKEVDHLPCGGGHKCLVKGLTLT